MNEVRSTIEHMKEYSLCFLFANNILYGKVNDIIDEYSRHHEMPSGFEKIEDWDYLLLKL